MPKTAEMALPVPTKTFLLRSPDTAMLFAPSGCTHPPPLVPPFLLSQNLSPKDIAGCDIMKLTQVQYGSIYSHNYGVIRWERFVSCCIKENNQASPVLLFGVALQPHQCLVFLTEAPLSFRIGDWMRGLHRQCCIKPLQLDNVLVPTASI